MYNIKALYDSGLLEGIIDIFGDKVGWDDLADYVNISYNSNKDSISIKPEGGLSKDDVLQLADEIQEELDDSDIAIKILRGFGTGIEIFNASSEYGSTLLSEDNFKLELEDSMNQGLDMFGYDDYDYDIEELGDGRIKVEVRAELDYDEFSEVIDNYLNPFIQKYDKDTYFEMEMPGIAVAFLDQTRRINR